MNIDAQDEYYYSVKPLSLIAKSKYPVYYAESDNDKKPYAMKIFPMKETGLSHSYRSERQI